LKSPTRSAKAMTNYQFYRLIAFSKKEIGTFKKHEVESENSFWISRPGWVLPRDWGILMIERKRGRSPFDWIGKEKDFSLRSVCLYRWPCKQI
jgi:hypothetical protein